MRLRSGKEVSVGTAKRKRQNKTRSKPRSGSPSLKQFKGQGEGSMAAATEYNDILGVVKVCLEYTPLQQAIEEANTRFADDTDELRSLVTINQITHLEALEAHGYKHTRPPVRPVLAAQYEALGLDRETALAQATKHLALYAERRKAIEAAILENAERAERARQERERERQHEEAMGNIEVQKMDIQKEETITIKKLEFENEDRKRKHELDLVDRANEQERFRLRTTATFGTSALVDPEGFYAAVKADNTKLATNIRGFFELIHSIVSDKLARRSVVGLLGHDDTPQPPTMQFTPREVPPMIVANKYKEDTQYPVLEAFNASLGDGHFHIANDSTAHVLENDKRPDHLAISRADLLAGEQKCALNTAMVIEQKVKRPSAEDFEQFLRYLHRVLRESGPGRTHVIGALVYRAPIPEQALPDPATISTIPPVQPAQLKTAKDPKPGFSRLVVDVYALFQDTLLPKPCLVRLEPAFDAATFFAALGSPDTTYANFQRSFALQSFTQATIEHITYKCVRFLGTGADTTGVWECVESHANTEEHVGNWDEPARGSTHSSVDQYGETLDVPIRLHSFVLKRSDGRNPNYEQEAAILRKLAMHLPDDVGKTFPELIKASIHDDRSFLLTKPVCRKVMRGSQIRMAHYFPANLQPYLRKLGELFVDYVETLKKCHELGIVHRDISLRNLMAAEIRADPLQPHNVERKGCIIDWECAAEVDPVTGIYDARQENRRVSFETVSDRYLHTGCYAPADDLVALVRCWKWATQPVTYKAVKQWRALSSNRQVQVNTIRLYWQRNRAELDELAEQANYDALQAYFRNPTYIEPIQPQQPSGEDESEQSLVYGDDEKEHEPQDFIERNTSITQFTRTLLDFQETDIPDDTLQR